MTKCVQAPEPDRVALSGQPLAAGADGSRREGRGERCSARAGVVGPDLTFAAVSVRVSRDLAVLAGVGGVGHPGRGGRAGDIGDRRDVIPVDAVPDAQQQTGQQHAEVDGGRGDGGGGADEVVHAMGLPRGWLKSVIDTGRYRNGLQLA